MSFISFTSYSQTQATMNKEAAESYQKADKELNETYQAILSEYKKDQLFIQNLKASQRIWIKFRDAELNLKYPETEPGYYGSIHPMCVSNYLEKLTRKRIKTLQIWINGIEEGNVCGGSVKIQSAEGDTYLIESNSFYGVSTGDVITEKSSLLQKDMLKTGEGDFVIYTLKNAQDEIIANVFPDPMDESKVGDISIITPIAKTKQGISIGMTFGELEEILGELEVHGSEIEGTTSVAKDNLRYRLDIHFWSYLVDKNKVDKNTKITEITISR